jgi:signal transduction histidine kinase
VRGAGPLRPARQDPVSADPAELAHALRAPLNGIRTWSQVLRDRLGTNPDPVVARALDGICAGIDQQVRVIENLLGDGEVQPPSTRSDPTRTP